MSKRRGKLEGNWDKERCQEEALKYNTRTEFRNGFGQCYRKSIKEGWLDEICSHMGGIKPRGYWTYERCQEEALKYETRTEFQKNSGSCYVRSNKKGWIDDICKHMKEVQKPNEYWTYERCKEEALKYETKKEFRDNSVTAYSISCKNEWFDEICSHMMLLRQPNGYWTYERCQEEALKYETKKEFQNNSVTAYTTSNKKGWMESISKHMVCGKLTWTYEKCKDEALKYETKKEFREKSISAYSVIISKGWTELFSHLVSFHKKWTKELLIEEINKYSSISDFQKNSSGAFIFLLYKTDYYDELIEPIRQQKANGYWTYERCKEEALKYSSSSEFYKNTESAYNKSSKKGWLREFFDDVRDVKPNGYWTEERIREVALQFENRESFKNEYSGAFDSAKRLNILDDVCSHMKGQIWKDSLKKDGYKYCPKCDTPKPFIDFGNNKANKDGLMPCCKACKTENDKAYRKQLRDKGVYSKRKREEYLRNIDVYKSYRDNYVRDYKKENKAIQSDPFRKLKNNIRKLILISYKRKGWSKKTKTQKILGCSFEEFEQHLNNNPYGLVVGNKDLDLDHIIPLGSVDCEKKMLELNHYTNFQLLPSEYNQCIKRDNPWDRDHFENWLSENYSW